MDVIDFAMQMELDGKAFYEKLEEMTPVAGMKKIFSILAADEEDHYEVMRGMKSGMIIELAGSTALETAKNIFQTMRFEESILADLKSKLEAYRYVIKIEADSIELYEDILKNKNMNWSPAEVALILKIIEEEKKHYNIMENLHDLIAEYDHFLTWREFDKVRTRGIL